ncbi:MAG: hypothetical protein JNM94_05010 [Phycisphaerae bacterium]|nr:hypothetical protein [Phycisphaerae bacterium]
MRRRPAIALVAFGIGTVATLGGCASTPTATPAATDTKAPPAAVDAALAPIPGSLLVPGPEGTVRWRSLKGLSAGKEYDVTTTATTVEGATFATRTADLEIAYWSINDTDGVRLHAVDSLGDKARSVFTPPLVIAPATLGADGCNAESAMRVLNLPKATTERERGTGTRTLRSVRDETITVDGTPTTARVVETTFVAALGAASAERTATIWVTKDLGMVAESWREKIVVLKVFPKETHQLSVRMGVDVPSVESSEGPPASDATKPAK